MIDLTIFQLRKKNGLISKEEIMWNFLMINLVLKNREIEMRVVLMALY